MQKYIIVNGKDVIIFDNNISHFDIGANLNVTSAGFVDREGNCFGQSDSLGICSSPNDSKIIKFFLHLSFKAVQ